MNQSVRYVPNIWPWNRTAGPTAPLAETGATTTDMNILAAVASALPDPCLVLDAAGIVVSSNELARDVLGLNPKGQHLSAAIRSPAVLEALERALRSGAPAQVDYEVRGPTARHFEAVVAPVVLAGAVVSALVLLKDLTREQRIERLRADFVANASHELRTPLASLLGFIETLQGAAKNDEKARDRFLDLMRVQAERMKRLIGDLLSLSRIEMSEHVPPTAEVDLSAIAQHVNDVLSPIARENGAELIGKFEPKLMVTGEWDELVQVAQNLVENAIKYAAAGKRIEISTRRENGHAELSVHDYGQGIPEEHLPRLTERFYRVSVQDSRARGGTGLGLAIVKHILNRHHGRLNVQSELGRGTIFTIRLPLTAIHRKD